MYKIKKGLSLPLSGAPIGRISNHRNVKVVGVCGLDFNGMKPSLFVKEGDHVLKGQKLFEDKKISGVNFCAPAAGKIISISRGEKRLFQNISIEVDKTEDSFKFDTFKSNQDYSREQLIDFLNQAGAWNSFRTRPFSKSPQLNATCHSIFVTAIDTNPLSINPDWVISKRLSEFKMGLEILTKLTDGNVYLCQKYGSKISTSLGKLADPNNQIKTEEFDGPHPAGNVGTHIHFIDPVDEINSVWHIGYQDLIALGSLVLTGKIYTDRVISLGGPSCSEPKILLTRVGADLSEITKDCTKNCTKDEHTRTISGSVFNGRTVDHDFHYLGKFDNQITMIDECIEREFMGWHQPGFDKFSVSNLFLSKIIPFPKFTFNTSTNGSLRAIVPTGLFEKVMPLDLLPTQLLKSLLIGDTDMAIELGALELDQEDLALCSFVCSGKNNYGKYLSMALDAIEKEG